jgi:hypothetical protein
MEHFGIEQVGAIVSSSSVSTTNPDAERMSTSRNALASITITVGAVAATARCRARHDPLGRGRRRVHRDRAVRAGAGVPATPSPAGVADRFGSVSMSPVGSPRRRENCAWGCPPDAVVSLALEAVDQSGAGALHTGCALLLRARRSDLALPPDPRAAPSAP